MNVCHPCDGVTALDYGDNGEVENDDSDDCVHR